MINSTQDIRAVVAEDECNLETKSLTLISCKFTHSACYLCTLQDFEQRNECVICVLLNSESFLSLVISFYCVSFERQY